MSEPTPLQVLKARRTALSGELEEFDDWLYHSDLSAVQHERYAVVLYALKQYDEAIDALTAAAWKSPVPPTPDWHETHELPVRPQQAYIRPEDYGASTLSPDNTDAIQRAVRAAQRRNNSNKGE